MPSIRPLVQSRSDHKTGNPSIFQFFDHNDFKTMATMSCVILRKSLNLVIPSVPSLLSGKDWKSCRSW